MAVSPAELAKIITAAMSEHHVKWLGCYIDDEDLTEAVIDGHFDMEKVAASVMTALKLST